MPQSELSRISKLGLYGIANESIRNGISEERLIEIVREEVRAIKNGKRMGDINKKNHVPPSVHNVPKIGGPGI